MIWIGSGFAGCARFRARNKRSKFFNRRSENIECRSDNCPAYFYYCTNCLAYIIAYIITKIII